jgi:ABC-type bacteriocin/lantibiotic exporter with double-glycine peptidase domain
MQRKDYQNSLIDMTAERIMPSQESSGWCGAACMAEAIKRRKGIKISQSEVAKVLGTTDENGTSLRQMVAGARKFGLEASIVVGRSLDKLQKQVDKGNIVILDWMSGHNLDEDGHYSLLEATTKKTITVNDSDGMVGSLRTFLKKDFKKVWFDVGETENTKKVAIVLK